MDKDEYRPTIVSECGGYSYEIPHHHFSRFNHYGYGNCDNEEQLTNRIVMMYEEMIIPSIKYGLCGCVYTQLSDVEDEINGLLTYDRKIMKVLPDQLKEISKTIQESLYS